MMNIFKLYRWRSRKFALWLKQMHNPDCEAAFKRMLQVGLITTLYDHAIFPTAEADRAAYEVRNEKGKVVPIPHPVSFFWDSLFCSRYHMTEYSPLI